MSKLVNTLKMIVILNHGGTTGSEELTKILGVGSNQVYLYAKFIKEAGFPIRSVTGLRGGYYFERKITDDNIFTFDICKDCKR